MIDQNRLRDDAYRRVIIDDLWQDYNTEIRHYCTTWLGGDLAEEITQEVFTSAWQALARYRPEQNLRAWLYGIAHKKCQQNYRNRARRRQIAEAFLADIGKRAHADEPTSPEQQMAETDQLKQLHDHLAQLPDEARILLNLRYWRDLSMEEIASVMGKSVPTIRKRLRQAEQRLRGWMNSGERSQKR